MDVQKSAQIFGYAGIIPFIAGVIGVWFVHGPLYGVIMQAFLVYAGLVLAFLGGVHWGAALYKEPPHPYQFWFSIAPLLIALLALTLSASFALVVFIMGYAAQWLIDRELMPETWFFKLRSTLTVIVVLCLGAVLLNVLL